MSRYVHLSSLALSALLPWAASAQMNAPLSGSSAQPAAVSAPVPPSVPAAAQPMPERAVVRQVQTPMPAVAPASPASEAVTQERAERVGDVTRALLAAQADGRRAGGALPILGPVATASWKRYLESFEQPIPQWFTEKVKTDRN